VSGRADVKPQTRFTLTFEDADPGAVGRLGGKGAGLARLTRRGLRVPPGYIVSTDACRRYLRAGTMPDGLADEVFAQLAVLEERSGKTFGGGPMPLLLSVRSGAPVSMPGMMDTILNLGLDRDAAVALAAVTGDSRFMADLVVRFHSMYSEIVLGALGDAHHAADLLTAIGPSDDPGTTYDRIWTACARALEEESGESVPQDPRDQLLNAVEAVFRSWNTRRARTYREFHRLPHDMGTAVVVQAMVFGNLSADSGSGVAFTRDPATGEPGLFGEYLAHSQGEDVVAGIRTPRPVREALPSAVLAELEQTCAGLEREHGDVLDIEFTVERSTLYFLQVRSAKRTPEAAVRIAADFLAEGTAEPAKALAPVSLDQVRQVQRPGFDAAELREARSAGRLLATGIGACPGQVSGVVVLDPDRAKERGDAGEQVILARQVTSPADLHGMIAAGGVLTATGGSTSHAAVVARALGKACVVGASAVRVDTAARTLVIGDRVIAEGEEISLDGGTGEVFTGRFAVAAPAAASGALASLLSVARSAAGCTVFSRVTLPADVGPALAAGATGLVTAVDDVLATSGHLDALVRELLEHRDVGSAPLEYVAAAVAREFAPLLSAAGDVEVGVRAIDFVADDSREHLQQTALTTQYPQFAVPLGLPELVQGQLEGLDRAIRDSGSGARVHLAVRHVSDPAEAAALRALRSDGHSKLSVGAYLTSPRAVFNGAGIAAESDVLWLEVRVLQAAMFGISARELLTAQPLDDYMRRGLLGTDPRTGVDPSLDPLLERLAAQLGDIPACRLGMRLSGAVSEEVVTRLYELGVRRFAVDADEMGPLSLALGKAAALAG
jgi:pyruvate,orthophosphate dikinase